MIKNKILHFYLQLAENLERKKSSIMTDITKMRSGALSGLVLDLGLLTISFGGVFSNPAGQS